MISSDRINKALHERHAIQRYVARRLFRVLELLGFHLVGDHFYEPIPNTRTIQSQYSDAPRMRMGIDFRFEESESYLLEILKKCGPKFKKSVERFGYEEKNYYFSGLDAVALYSFVRDSHPKRIVEIGQGYSTRVIAAALADNRADGVDSEFVTVDPYLRLGQSLQEGRVITKPVQELDPSEAEMLANADFLFVDSSHVYKFGSDVKHLFESIYPSVRPGSVIHIHDIFSPYDYPKKWLLDAHRFWNEGYLLESFLQFNSVFEVLLPLHFLVRDSGKLAAEFAKSDLIPGKKLSGSSFYLRRRASEG